MEDRIYSDEYKREMVALFIKERRELHSSSHSYAFARKNGLDRREFMTWYWNKAYNESLRPTGLTHSLEVERILFNCEGFAVIKGGE